MPKVYRTPLLTKITIIFSLATILIVPRSIIKDSEFTSIEQLPAYNCSTMSAHISSSTHNESISSPDKAYYHKTASDPVIYTDQDNLGLWIDQISQSYGVDPSLIRAIIEVESGWKVDAISSSGEHVGLMQLSTKWQRARANKLGVQDLSDPYSNVLVGIDYISYTLKETHGDVSWTLMIYNQGYQSAYENHLTGVETSYVHAVMREYQRLSGVSINV